MDVALKSLAALKELTNSMNAILFIFDQRMAYALFQKQKSKRLAAILQGAKRGATANSQASRASLRTHSPAPATPSIAESRVERARRFGQKYMVDGQWVDILTDADVQIGDPIFDTPADTKFGIKG